MSLVVYVFEESKDRPTHEQELFDIDAAGFFVDMSAVFVERSSCTLPASSRTAFQRALRRLQSGDTLITTKLWSLGNSIADVVATLAQLCERGISTICLAYGKVDLCSGEGKGFIQTLQLADDLERITRRSRAREAAFVAKERGITQGRPSSLSAAQQKQALMSLGAGSSVTEIARSLNTSRQTIMRLRDAHATSRPDNGNRSGEGNRDGALETVDDAPPLYPVAVGGRH